MSIGSDFQDLVTFRRTLHQFPELSGQETETSKRIAGFLEHTQPDQIITGLGGTGVAATYNGNETGPTVMLRAELDALPISEINQFPHASTVSNAAHLCGHDGHMAMICGVASLLGQSRPARGRAVLLFQPAEETGIGARSVLDDPKFTQLAPDYSFSLHNLPGLELGHVGLSSGPVNCCSRGLRIKLSGITAHASMPETGRSPMTALTEIMPALSSFGTGGALTDGFRLVTITHAEMGEPAFGISPADAVLMATLRCLSDGDMGDLCTQAENLVTAIAKKEKLEVSLTYHDVFEACQNNEDAVAILKRACTAENILVRTDLGPMRWSEDFGQFGNISKSAMFLLGSGVNQPQLHNPDYDFPDELISTGISVFHQVIRDLLG
jgi:amidohydrolase